MKTTKMMSPIKVKCIWYSHLVWYYKLLVAKFSIGLEITIIAGYGHLCLQPGVFVNAKTPFKITWSSTAGAAGGKVGARGTHGKNKDNFLKIVAALKACMQLITVS